MPLSDNKALLTKRQRLDAIAQKPLEPIEFCQRWVRFPAPGERGYQSACVRELAKVCGVTERTVERWGTNFERRPETILTLLRNVDLRRQMTPYFERHLAVYLREIRD